MQRSGLTDACVACVTRHGAYVEIRQGDFGRLNQFVAQLCVRHSWPQHGQCVVAERMEACLSRHFGRGGGCSTGHDFGASVCARGGVVLEKRTLFESPIYLFKLSQYTSSFFLSSRCSSGSVARNSATMPSIRYDR